MADHLDPTQRSTLMSRIRGAHTRPELAVRRAAFALGYRFRLHRRDLPGTPDLVFPGRRKAVFVHGCFWHRHPGCRRATEPKSQVGFWLSKFERNVARDADAERRLLALGWNVLTIWECETRDRVGLEARLRKFLGPAGSARARASADG